MGSTMTDVLLVGSGLGAIAAAKRLAEAGLAVVLVPGIGRTRSAHIDGGLVDAALVEDAFGPAAPLGSTVSRRQVLEPLPDHRFRPGSLESTDPKRIYHRSTLECWAMDRAVRAGAVYLDDFIEGKALPNPDGSMTLTSERDERTVKADLIVLCEGADPRIPLRVKLRPDYGPEDQIHFARTMFHGQAEPVYRHGTWRTGWGMPVQFALVPQQEGVIVSVAARIENVMRGSRSSKDALEDFLASPECRALGIEGERQDTGVELVAVRPNRRQIPYVHDRLWMGIDASGVIDARWMNRADLTVQSGLRVANYLTGVSDGSPGWEETARRFVDGSVPPGTAYHDDRGTGFLEDGSAHQMETITRRVARLIRRGR